MTNNFDETIRGTNFEGRLTFASPGITKEEITEIFNWLDYITDELGCFIAANLPDYDWYAPAAGRPITPEKIAQLAVRHRKQKIFRIADLNDEP